MPDEMSVSRIVFDRDENHLPCSDADRDWLIAEVESLEAELKDDRGVRAVVMNEQYAELDGLPEKSMRIYEAIRSLRQQVERLEADLEEAEQSHYIADLESRIAVVKECLSGIEWHGLTISVNHRSNVDRAILALRDIAPAAKDNANA